MATNEQQPPRPNGTSTGPLPTPATSSVPSIQNPSQYVKSTLSQQPREFVYTDTGDSPSFRRQRASRACEVSFMFFFIWIGDRKKH